MKHKNELQMPLHMMIRRRHYLYFFYYWIYSFISDMKISGKRLDKTIFNKDKNAYPVQCISYQYIHELEKFLELHENDVFVDVGCAWGRLIGYLRKKYTIKKYIGVELNSLVANEAQKIFAKQKDVDIICGDIVEKIPKDATVFYLFNPFSDEIMRSFLRKIEECSFETGLQIWYLHPVHKEVFNEFPQWRLLMEQKLKPKYMGEIVLNCYEYLNQKNVD